MMSNRRMGLVWGRLAVASLSLLCLLGLALPTAGCGEREKGTGGASPMPPPAPRRVRFLNDKKPRPKLWLKQDVGGAVIDVPPGPSDEGTAEYEIDPAASSVMVTVDTDGSGGVTSADYTATRAVSKVFLDYETLLMSGTTGWSVYEIVAQRDGPSQPWDIEHHVWP